MLDSVNVWCVEVEWRSMQVKESRSTREDMVA